MSVFPSRFFIFAAVLWLAACSKAEPEQQVQPERPVKLHLVNDNSSGAVRQFPAVVEPTERASLTFRVSGKLVKLQARPGQMVEKGDLLAALDDTDFRLKLDQAAARYELAQTQFVRAEQLIAQKLVSQAAFDEAKAQLQVAQADLSTAETALSYTQLRAPFAGNISRLLVENHENIAAQQAIMELQVRDQVDVVIQVPEDVISNVRKDFDYQPEVVFDSHPQFRYRARIREWDTRADPATNSFKVVFSMATPQEFNVLAGMTANVIAEVSKISMVYAEALYIPASALFMPGEQPLASQQSYVWVYNPDSGTVSKRAIRVSSLTSAGAAVTDGLQRGEQIVSAGVQQLTEGQKVRPWVRERGL
ncbi:MAG: efflux RND transporter periplasmic adaptor subunit [Gammaproteobacteria bacterium]|nr:efflux RND transporter periplasmic adaptor subunit [Gammaproteobacteria bacterium]MBU1556927.1 efflux RND transporter periplasmic adaptor subunit [Gammaproteobacteria bacterium]MBU2071208.1 efflux RND transporter periplasmic adaptor subunit [Gammaproteobacteria bacterium]MBU2181955.1 efflux RND transporter periplasmic adaptor subunit [Gammaproteobacteria bacterium]MBU2203957.1 efflux RND transporter periplasmic adaptor subunit [Gammaproteobacteria bacterium]